MLLILSQKSKSIFKVQLLHRRKNVYCYNNTRYFSEAVATNSSVSHALVLSSSSSSSRFCCYVHSGLSAGLMPYIRGHAWQTGLLQQMLSSPSCGSSSCDRLLLFQHDPVYTLGRGANEQHLLFFTRSKPDSFSNNPPKEEEMHQYLSSVLCRSNKASPAHLSFSNNHTIHVKSTFAAMSSDTNNNDNGKLLYEEKKHKGTPIPTAPNGAAIYRVERGGKVTFHGPGILVVYPLLDLRRYKQDLHWYLRQIEEVIIQVLDLYDIAAYRDEDTGVWVNGNKIAAVGISASRWITTHGFALNVSPDIATYFDPSIIIPCGISDKGITSMEQELKTPICIREVAQKVQTCFENVFDVPLKPGDDLQ